MKAALFFILGASAGSLCLEHQPHNSMTQPAKSTGQVIKQPVHAYRK